MTRTLIYAFLLIAAPACARAERTVFSKMLKASVVFHEDTGLAFSNNRAEYTKAIKEYPHILDMFLCLENTATLDVSWVADSNGVAIRAELIDAKGRPVSEAGHMTSTMYNPMPYRLPYGSRMDWYVSGFSAPFRLKEEKSKGKDYYVLSINSHLWLIPIKSANSYTLRLRLYGYPWSDRPPESRNVQQQLLLELPSIKIKVTR